MKTRHLISVLLLMLLGCAALGSYLVWQYQLPSKVIARVNETDIPQPELELQLRAVLWRQGKEWDHLSHEEQSSLQFEATNALIDKLLVKNWAATLPASAGSAQTESDFQQFLKQFESPDGWKERATLQGLTEPRLREIIAAETAQRAAVEAYLSKSAAVAEEEEKSWFEGHSQELLIPESVRASHIFLSSHDQSKPDRTEEIRMIYQQWLNKEATFPELATKFSEDERSKLKGGELGWLTRQRVTKEFADTVFSLSPNEISKPFQSTLGWHIVWLQDRRAERLPQFIEVQLEITALLESRKREGLLQELMQGLRKKARVIRNEKLIRQTHPAVP